MTTRHQLSAAILHGGSIDPLALAIVHRLLTRPPCQFVLRIVARWMGIIPSDYDTSADAGKPHRKGENE
jgi:hypothetical protein